MVARSFRELDAILRREGYADDGPLFNAAQGRNGNRDTPVISQTENGVENGDKTACVVYPEIWIKKKQKETKET